MANEEGPKHGKIPVKENMGFWNAEEVEQYSDLDKNWWYIDWKGEIIWGLVMFSIIAAMYFSDNVRFW